jgi:hypothetical protein
MSHPARRALDAWGRCSTSVPTAAPYVVRSRSGGRCRRRSCERRTPSTPRLRASRARRSSTGSTSRTRTKTSPAASACRRRCSRWRTDPSSRARPPARRWMPAARPSRPSSSRSGKYLALRDQAGQPATFPAEDPPVFRRAFTIDHIVSCLYGVPLPGSPIPCGSMPAVNVGQYANLDNAYLYAQTCGRPRRWRASRRGRRPSGLLASEVDRRARPGATASVGTPRGDRGHFGDTSGTRDARDGPMRGGRRAKYRKSRAL